MPLYYLDHENQAQPMEDEIIHAFVEQGILTDSTYVWKEGLTEWVFFESIKEQYVSLQETFDLGFQEGSPLWEILNHETFLVKRALDTPEGTADFDVFEPEMGALILECREVMPELKGVRKNFSGRLDSYNIVLRLPHTGHQVARLSGRFPRAFGLSPGKVSIYNDEDQLIGILKKGNGRPDLVILYSLDEQVRLVSVRGSVEDWDFQIIGAGFSPMTTSRNWDGDGKELITEDGNFAIVFPSTMPHNDPIREMTLITMLSLERLLL